MTAPAGLWRQGDEEPERPLRLPVPAYLIETESERILVDTGLHPDAVTDPEARYGEGTALGHFGLEQEEGLAEQVDLGTVTRLVLTHLHFDHAGGLALIPKSVPVVLQRAEWEAAHDRAGVERNFFQPADYADDPPDLTLIDGDHDLLGDGSIELLSTPGHTSGPSVGADRRPRARRRRGALRRRARRPEVPGLRRRPGRPGQIGRTAARSCATPA